MRNSMEEIGSPWPEPVLMINSIPVFPFTWTLAHPKRAYLLIAWIIISGKANFLNASSIIVFFSTIFVAPGVGPSFSWRIHYGFAWRCFPILGRELKFFGADGGFPHPPGSTGSGHFLCTIVSRLGFCYYNSVFNPDYHLDRILILHADQDTGGVP